MGIVVSVTVTYVTALESKIFVIMELRPYYDRSELFELVSILGSEICKLFLVSTVQSELPIMSS